MIWVMVGVFLFLVCGCVGIQVVKVLKASLGYAIVSDEYDPFTKQQMHRFYCVPAASRRLVNIEGADDRGNIFVRIGDSYNTNGDGNTVRGSISVLFGDRVLMNQKTSREVELYYRRQNLKPCNESGAFASIEIGADNLKGLLSKEEIIIKFYIDDGKKVLLKFSDSQVKGVIEFAKLIGLDWESPAPVNGDKFDEGNPYRQRGKVS